MAFFVEFLAGEVVNSLIGFLSEGEVEFIVTGIEASLRYFSYSTLSVLNATTWANVYEVVHN